MKKICYLFMALLCAMTMSAQEVKTHSVYDVNQNDEVTVEDATIVVDKVKANVAAAQTQQYVTADDLSVLLKNILNDLKLIKEKLGIVDDDRYNGHKFVDLGLPSGLKWATCNVGADNPEDYGDYYAWGEMETKSTYDWSMYKWMTSGYSDWKFVNKYTCPDGLTSGIWYSNGTFVGDNKTTLEPEDDVAQVKWGGDWRMPTKTELDELCDTNNCTWTWTTQGGKKGYKVTSKKNGNSIFLPASGYHYASLLNDAGSQGYYWSSSLSCDYTCSHAYGLSFYSGNCDSSHNFRYRGFTVRPVCP